MKHVAWCRWSAITRINRGCASTPLARKQICVCLMNNMKKKNKKARDKLAFAVISNFLTLGTWVLEKKAFPLPC